MTKKTLLAVAVQSALGVMFRSRAHMTQDVAFGYRMGAGFPGDVNRTHPAGIVPGLLNTSVQSPRLFGDPVIVDTATNSYRGFVAGDVTSPTFIDGVLVRPYPTQQTSGGMTASFGTGAPAAGQPCDVLEDGFIMVKVNNGGTPTKDGAVYVYTAVSSGNHVQGGFEAAAGANLMLINNAVFNGPPDANGIAELRVWRQLH
jgi:hypothetical protein